MNILVGYDGSNAGRDALRLGIRHVQAFGGRLFIIRSLGSGAAEDMEKIENAQRDLSYAETLCRENRVFCDVRLLIRGLEPGEDIVTFANENDIEEIIVGVKRRSRVGKIIFGSTARYVIMEARCPVVTVK
ncbi:MAG: universal stress protein [Desulfobacterales bacterium]